jgi:hypothetical protein
MATNPVALDLLVSILRSPSARKLFTTIAANRIAEVTQLRAADPNVDRELIELQSNDLIGAGSGEKYYVTAKGLKVARLLENLPAS